MESWDVSCQGRYSATPKAPHLGGWAGTGQPHQRRGRTATPRKPQQPCPAIRRVRCLRGRTPSPGVDGDLGRLLPGSLFSPPQSASPGQLGSDNVITKIEPPMDNSTGTVPPPRPVTRRACCLRGREPSPGTHGKLGRLLPGSLSSDPQAASPGQLGKFDNLTSHRPACVHTAAA